MNELKVKGEFQLEKEDLKKINETFCSCSLSEDETRSIINKIYKTYQELVDPHTAVAIGALKKIVLQEKTIILATAHPSKFPDIVKKETDINPEVPKSLKSILNLKENYIKMPADLKKIQNFILENI